MIQPRIYEINEKWFIMKLMKNDSFNLMNIAIILHFFNFLS